MVTRSSGGGIGNAMPGTAAQAVMLADAVVFRIAVAEAVTVTIVVEAKVVAMSFAT